MSEKKSNLRDERIRNWTFLVYPESAPQSWRDVLDELHIAWVESPLHNKDDNADGEQKKEHWHILLLFEGKKSYEQVKEITDKLNATIPQKVASAKGLVRYMAHLDNPEKYQYDRAAIIGHGGADVAEYLKPTSSTRYQLIREMVEYVKTNGIIEMCDLVEYAMTERFDDWFPLLCDNSAYIMGSVLKSYRHRADQQPSSRNVDLETGEVIE